MCRLPGSQAGAAEVLRHQTEHCQTAYTVMRGASRVDACRDDETETEEFLGAHKSGREAQSR